MKKLVLITNEVMHYRVSVYNYFFHKFKELGWELIVISNKLQKQNTHPLVFEFKEMGFNFTDYKREVKKIDPDCVIIFLHLKDKIIIPLVHWLKLKKIPIVFWTKGLNLDKPNSKISYLMYRYMHRIFDGIILYSENERKFISARYQNKVFVANNTVNFMDYPKISESKEQIKKEFNIPFEKVVLSVGRMGEGGGRKKIHHLIEIFNDVRLNNAGLVIVGSGMNNDLLKKMNRMNTIYLGEVHDNSNIQISKLFKMADVFSIPGHVGLGLNQAFYWGLPIVTMEGAQPPEINYLINGRNGFIVPENDLVGLKNKIICLLINDDKRQLFSQNAKDDIEINASIDMMFMGFMNCIRYVT